MQKLVSIKSEQLTRIFEVLVFKIEPLWPQGSKLWPFKEGTCQIGPKLRLWTLGLDPQSCHSVPLHIANISYAANLDWLNFSENYFWRVKLSKMASPENKRIKEKIEDGYPANIFLVEFFGISFDKWVVFSLVCPESKVKTEWG